MCWFKQCVYYVGLMKENAGLDAVDHAGCVKSVSQSVGDF